ncbi:hypothetical protein ONZ43_g3691 [Nemania bipapillata]|uniref:Uncharacterized protein n=1 Tax=Nemania bipapillata TaxID=110536 RepID=A0ACC2IVW1_9PEZI|nr:hypothetical protein ONZ43_g3691 [Nemania bipapillata]
MDLEVLPEYEGALILQESLDIVSQNVLRILFPGRSFLDERVIHVGSIEIYVDEDLSTVLFNPYGSFWLKMRVNFVLINAPYYDPSKFIECIGYLDKFDTVYEFRSGTRSYAQLPREIYWEGSLQSVKSYRFLRRLINMRRHDVDEQLLEAPSDHPLLGDLRDMQQKIARAAAKLERDRLRMEV